MAWTDRTGLTLAGRTSVALVRHRSDRGNVVDWWNRSPLVTSWLETQIGDQALCRALASRHPAPLGGHSTASPEDHSAAGVATTASPPSGTTPTGNSTCRLSLSSRFLQSSPRSSPTCTAPY